jgi:Na+/H+ antiporter NhaD/arsenite permease-like protein
VSAIAALVLLTVFYLTNRKALRDAHRALTGEMIAEIEALHQEPLHVHLTRVGLVGFLAAVALLIFHRPLTTLSGLPINAAAAALVPAGTSLLLLKDDQRKKTVLKVDSESIVFFAGLFIIIGGLEKTHVFETLAKGLAASMSANPVGLVMALHWGPGLASGIVDNVPLALAMSYVIKDLAHIPGMPALGLMLWSLALGIDMGGNLTPIGASANVVAYSFMEKNNGSIGWLRWIKVAVPPTILAMLLASMLVMFKGQIGWY